MEYENIFPVDILRKIAVFFWRILAYHIIRYEAHLAFEKKIFFSSFLAGAAKCKPIK